jgi:hypothetical protein
VKRTQHRGRPINRPARKHGCANAEAKRELTRPIACSCASPQIDLRPVTAAAWEVPVFADADLKYSFGDSVIEQFALGHTASDILRELCQNEYDAGGDHLLVRFGEEALEVSGDGTPIDRHGWKRLSVMLGTGRIGGTAEQVEPKLNGIGSKNHGLRSLFRIGDQVFVRSGGRQTLLDLSRGAPLAPVADPSSSGTRGVRIVVPYRSETHGRLEPFDLLRERHDLEEVEEQLAPTLLKLADPRAARSLRRVTVTSQRCAKTLEWRQQVKRLRAHALGGPVLLRTVALRTEAGDDASARVISEREYQANFEVPAHFIGHRFPRYFQVRGGHARIGVSLPLKRKRPDHSHPGSFYYPLGCANGRTGSGIGVNAPFEMNGDRSALLDPGTSSWNAWLLEAAAGFALSLLVKDWFREFGADAYRVVSSTQQGSVAAFSEHLEDGLRSRDCWPTRARQPGTRRPAFAAASAISLEQSPELGELLAEKERLHRELDDPDVHELAIRAGAKRFSISSAVRLRCDASRFRRSMRCMRLTSSRRSGNRRRRLPEEAADLQDLGGLERRPSKRPTESWDGAERNWSISRRSAGLRRLGIPRNESSGVRRSTPPATTTSSPSPKMETISGSK